MWKWISWVVRMGATALLLSFLCIWTTGYIVNSYMETLIKQLELPIETRPFALSGIWGTLWGADSPPAKEADPSETPAKETASEAGTSTADRATASPQPSSAEPSQHEDGTGDLPSPNAEASPDPEDGSLDSEPVFNGGSGSGQLSAEERQALYAVVVSKLKPEQLKLLSDSLEGGLTAEELNEVGAMLKESLSDQEYEQMMGLLQGTAQPEPVPPTEG